VSLLSDGAGDFVVAVDAVPFAAGWQPRNGAHSRVATAVILR
jgi:hypothetical protein